MEISSFSICSSNHADDSNALISSNFFRSLWASEISFAYAKRIFSFCLIRRQRATLYLIKSIIYPLLNLIYLNSIILRNSVLKLVWLILDEIIASSITVAKPPPYTKINSVNLSKKAVTSHARISKNPISDDAKQ